MTGCNGLTKKRKLREKVSQSGGQANHHRLAFSDPGYLDLMSYEDISKSRRLLETVVAKTKTKKQQARAKMLLKAFTYYEASAISYLGLVRQIKQPGKSRKYYEIMNLIRTHLINKFEKDPVLVHPRRFDRYKDLRINQFQNPSPNSP